MLTLVGFCLAGHHNNNHHCDHHHCDHHHNHWIPGTRIRWRCLPKSQGVDIADFSDAPQAQNYWISLVVIFLDTVCVDLCLDSFFGEYPHSSFALSSFFTVTDQFVFFALFDYFDYRSTSHIPDSKNVWIAVLPLNVGKTIMNHPLGNGLCHLFMVIWGMV